MPKNQFSGAGARFLRFRSIFNLEMSKLLHFFASKSLFSRKTAKFLSTEIQDERTFKLNKKIKIGMAIFGAVAGGATVFGLYLEKSISKAADFVVHPVEVPFFHKTSVWHGYDVKAVRRGYQVYKQVCQACHSIMLYEYRHFVNQIMTEEEAKAEAAELMIEDGPNDEGNYFTRPGKLTDQLPKPYKTEVHAKLANNMALPPDLMLITLARHGGEDYIFHLLTGYQEAPAGITLGPGQAYNPYFPNGSVLSMGQQLYDDMLEYEDGTPATQSQMAKDVATFLTYLARPEMPDLKRYAIKLAVMSLPVAFVLLYLKRFIWTSWKSQKVVFRKIKGREEFRAPRR